MSDLSAYSAHEFGPLCTVLRSVMDITARPGEQIMLVGASARDLIHRGLGFDSELASTTDIDIAIAVPDRFAYQSVITNLEPEGDTRIRFRIDKWSVDLIPFGGIENPSGTAVPHPDGHTVDVFAFQEVFDGAELYRLPEGIEVRVPTAAGYAALKIKAWVDKGALGWTKHARDLSYVCMWYQNSPGLNDSLYDYEKDADLFELANFDQDLASTYLLGRHIRATIGGALADQLGTLWNPASRKLMASSERNDRFLASAKARDYDTRLQYFNAIHAALSAVQSQANND
ncbi:hypothetical protein [Arthrobacter sp. SRS-W-1-2016]|uniref:hypothetical protein n=1 Tax=Arthrobacter sp. SRS-W-1-2016 TaxID=1930254 RepID=UPI001116C3A1|nr:hypothetical protein [Arthrobacter sp. SRS-W-1-2016]